MTDFLGAGYSYPRSIGEPRHLAAPARNFVTRNYSFVADYSELGELSLHRFNTIQQCNRQTDTQTDVSTIA